MCVSILQTYFKNMEHPMPATVTLPNGQAKQVMLTQFLKSSETPLQDQLWHQAYQLKGDKIRVRPTETYEQVIENIALGTSAQLLKDTQYYGMADPIQDALLKDDSLKEKLQPILRDAAHNYAMHQKKEQNIEQHGFAHIEHLEALRQNALDHQVRLEKAIQHHSITIDLSQEQGVPPPQTHGAAQIDKAHTNEKAVG
jgi:hypothetical protein